MQNIPKNPVQATPVVQPVKIGPGYRVQVSRIQEDMVGTIKCAGAFKMKVVNQGTVGINIFGSCDIPSYATEVFETGDPSLGFEQDAAIAYDTHTPTDSINLLIHLYFK